MANKDNLLILIPLEFKQAERLISDYPIIFSCAQVKIQSMEFVPGYANQVIRLRRNA